MHIYFGHTGVHLLPFIEQWDKPCVVSFHGADVAHKKDIKDYPAKLRRLFNAVPLVFARSQSLVDRLIQLGCPPEKLRINRTGIPLNEFPFVDRQPPRDGKWRVVQACRLIPKKGVATSLRAFAIFKKDNPKAEFFIAGKGPLQPELEMLADGLGILRDVHFVGFLSQRKLLELYASSHLFLHPSEISANQDQEGVPNSVLGSDGDWVAGGCNASWWDTGSGRAWAHRVSCGRGRSRWIGERHATNHAFAGSVNANGSTCTRYRGRTIRAGRSNRPVRIVLRRSDQSEWRL